MIKKMVWAIPVSIGAVALAATAIGVGYTQSQKANPYADFYRRPSQPGDTSLIDAYTSAVQLGAKVIVGPGFTQANPIKASASQQYFKNHNTGFLLLDETFGAAPGGYQVASVTYRVSEAGFLAGIALGEYLNYYQSIFAPGTDDRLTYAAWGGGPYATILTFMAGFQQGINYFNNFLIPTINNNKGNSTTKYKPIQQITDKESFAGGFAPQQGTPLAQRLFSGTGTQTWPVYEQGPVTGTSLPEWQNKSAFEDGPVGTGEVPDAVLVVAGPQVTAAIDQLNLNNAKSVIVGVDVAQEEDQALNQPLQKPHVGKDVIANYPVIDGFSKKERQNLAKAFSYKGSEVTQEIIAMIAEISPHKESYDDHMVKFVMQDGNKIYSSYESVQLLNAYKKTLKNLKKDHVCFVMDANTETYITENCKSFK